MPKSKQTSFVDGMVHFGEDTLRCEVHVGKVVAWKLGSKDKFSWKEEKRRKENSSPALG